MTNIEEVWKDITNYIGHYQVSNLGNVRSVDRIIKINGSDHLYKGIILKKHLSRGYHAVMLSKNNISCLKLLHRIIATEFIENPNNYPEINHKDLCRTNNNDLSNLEWCTHKENINHAVILHRIKNGNRHSWSKLTHEIVDSIRHLKNDKNMKLKDIAKKFGISYTHTRAICNGTCWNHTYKGSESDKYENKKE
jgi:hypothetical protein